MFLSLTLRWHTEKMSCHDMRMGTLKCKDFNVKINMHSTPHTVRLTGVLIEDVPVQYAFAGDNATLVVTNIDQVNLTIGKIIRKRDDNKEESV
jgi:translation elongation factor EF-1alpha